MAGGQDDPLIWLIPLLLASGAAIGLLNGVGVACFGVPPIIMTLAVNGILQGLILVYTGGSPTPSTPEFINFLVVGRIGQIPVIVWIWMILALLASVLLSKSAFGHHLYVLGTNATVAEFSGVPAMRNDYPYLYDFWCHSGTYRHFA